MKLLISITVLALLFLIQCSNSTKAQKNNVALYSTSIDISTFDVSGNYHWKSHRNSTYDQDNYIILRKRKNKIEGYYYGNSDEFSSSSHGIWPGYFVLKMEELKLFQDSITFKLRPTKDDFFNKPISFSVFNSHDALDSGNTRWNYVEDFSFAPVKEYSGSFSDSTSFWLDMDEFSNNEERLFTKEKELHNKGNRTYEEYFRSIIQNELSNTKSKIAVLPFEAFYLEWMKEKKTPYKGRLEPKDIDLIMNLLKKSIQDYNTSQTNLPPERKILSHPIDNFEENYVIQIVPYLNPANEREAFVNCVCIRGVYNDWRKELIIVEGGGNCYFRVIVNLDKKTSTDFWVNAPM